MKYITINFVLLLLFFISKINQIQCLCVLESDFGFSINCNFKKSGLFRVRNLGGLKAHFGLGFSLGDELGFPESLGNVEANKKRSLDVRMGNNAIGVLPAAQMPVTSIRMRPQATISPSHYMQIQTMIPRPAMSAPKLYKKQPLMTEASSLPLGVPRFKTIPKGMLKVKEDLYKHQITSSALPKYNDQRQLSGANRFLKAMATTGVQTSGERVSVIYSAPVPEFQALPSSIVTAQIVEPTKVEYHPKEEKLPEVDLKGHTVEELAAVANVSVDVIKAAIKLRQQQMALEKKIYANFPKQQTLKKPTTPQSSQIVEFQWPEKVVSYSTTAEPSTTRYIPKKKVTKKPIIKNGHKVMNAPKEFYPVGYEKNFDDSFKSRIDLPATSFHCGDQKHFPGLYGDQDLGCMVFHVCAITDDGLVMKSFLCPESTLFDQTILKCNWWFYTDCKDSKSLYDSNLPVSKSYQLMKSLSYFNKHYKSSTNSTSTELPEKSDEDNNNNIQEAETPKVTIITAKDHLQL